MKQMASENQIIANNILTQISLATKMACGFRELTIGTTADKIPYLNIRVGANKQFMYVRVYYMPSDHYNIEVLTSKKGYEETLQEFEDVYYEQLSSIIYHAVNK
jgi:hypothetical protein